MYKVYMVYFIIEIVYYNTFIALLPFRIMYILSYIFPVGVIITIPGLYHCKITKVLDKVCIILILSYLFVIHFYLLIYPFHLFYVAPIQFFLEISISTRAKM